MLTPPPYDRSGLVAGVVHVGVGAFHRSHLAMYHDRLLRAGAGGDLGICGVGVLPGDRAMRDALRSQDHLYTLVVKHPDGTHEPQVIGSIVDYLFAPDDPAAVVERMAAPTTRIVSLTVTEGGYEDPHGPAFELIVAALARRRANGLPPFTVMSCDNLPGNGRRAREVLRQVAPPDLWAWIDAHGAFPSSMVDRITPRTTDGDRRDLRERFGIDDAWPVVCEPFVQWVLEDDFADGRPPYEDVGVQLVDDVEPYELMKLRLLNVGHQALCYFAHLIGYRLVHDAAADPLLRSFVRTYMDREATPTLAPVPGIDLDDYKATLIERFSNPEVGDTVARLCAESSDRIPKWLGPVVRANLDHGGEVLRSAAIVASWARYAEGVDEQGRPIEVVDQLRDRVMANARAGTFLDDRQLFGDLGDDQRWRAPFQRVLDSLHERGAAATLAWLDGEPGMMT